MTTFYLIDNMDNKNIEHILFYRSPASGHAQPKFGCGCPPGGDNKNIEHIQYNRDPTPNPIEIRTYPIRFK